MTSVNDSGLQSKLETIRELNIAKRERHLRMASLGLIWGATGLVGLAALGLGLWSNQVVAQWLGVPGKAGWIAAGVIDGIWVVTMAIVQLHHRQPWRALTSYYVSFALVILSAVTNFGHGLIRFGGHDVRGYLAGGLFALLPLGLKWLLSAATNNEMATLTKAPDARKRIRQVGQVVAAERLNRVLDAAMDQEFREVPAEPQRVQLDRVPVREEVPVTSEQLDQLDKVKKAWKALAPVVEPEVPARTDLEPAQVPVVPVPELPQFTTRKEKVQDLAALIADRGGQPSAVPFSEMSLRYGSTAKATLSALRKDAHQAYLNGVSVGQYL